MATLIGSFEQKSSSVDIHLSVRDIYLEDTTREPNEGPMTEEFVKVDLVYHFVRNEEDDELFWDTNIPEPSGQDVLASDILVLIKELRKQAAREVKKRVEVFENTYEMFDILLFAEPGYKNGVDISTSGSFGIDDGIILRLYPSDDSLIRFANELEKELNTVIAKSKQRYKERVAKAKSLGILH